MVPQAVGQLAEREHGEDRAEGNKEEEEGT